MRTLESVWKIPKGWWIIANGWRLLSILLVFSLVNSVDIFVNTELDFEGSSIACLNATEVDEACSLRAAWESCHLQADPCNIYLPEYGTFVMNETLGSLYQRNGSDISIYGNFSDVYSSRYYDYIDYGDGQVFDSSHLYLSTPDVYDYSGAVDVNTTYVHRFTACGKSVTQKLVFSTCVNRGGSFVGYPAMRLLDDQGYELVSNSNYCLSGAEVSLLIQAYSPCSEYSLLFGAASLKTAYAAANITLTVYNYTVYPSFIRQLSSDNQPVSLHLSDINLMGFGSGAVDGGVVYLDLIRRFSIYNSFFAYNFGAQGGVIYLQQSEVTEFVHISYTTMYYNSAKGKGGAVFLTGAYAGCCGDDLDSSMNTSTSLELNYFSDNLSEGVGGSIALYSHLSHVAVTDSTFDYSTAYTGGGAIYVGHDNHFFTVSRCTIYSPQTFSTGSAMLFASLNSLIMIDDMSVTVPKDLGDVIAFLSDNSDISISNMYMDQFDQNFCPTAFAFYNSVNVSMAHVYSRSCSLYFAYVSDSHHLRFFNITLVGNGNGWEIESGSDVVIDAAVVEISPYANLNNTASFVFLTSARNVIVQNCFVQESNAGFLTYSSNVVFINITYTGSFSAKNLYVGVGNDDVTVQNVVFLNQAHLLIWLNNSYVNVHNCRFLSTFVGIYMTKDNSHIQIRDCTFSGQKHLSGLYMIESNQHVSVQRCVFRDIITDYRGGAISIYQGNKDVTVTNCLIEHNKALADNGGGILIGTDNERINLGQVPSTFEFSINRIIRSDPRSTSSATDKIWLDKTFDLGADVVGCYVYFDDDAVVEDNNVPFLVYSTAGALIVSIDAGSLPGVSSPAQYLSVNKFRLVKSVVNLGSLSTQFVRLYILPIRRSGVLEDTLVVRNNAATGNGGGIFIGEGNKMVNIVNTHIAHNTATDNGGGIAIENVNSECQMVGVQLEGNEAGGDGGGVYVGNSNTAIVLRSSTLRGNVGTGNGGGLFIQRGNGYGLLPSVNQITMDQVRITNNAVGTGHGAGVFVEALNQVHILNSFIVNNTAASATATDQQHGGGVYSQESNSVSLLNSLLAHNVAGQGGGMWIGSASTLNLGNGLLISNNRAVDGGAMYLQKVTSWTVEGQLNMSSNVASGLGGGLVLEQTSSWQVSSAGSSQVAMVGNSAVFGSAAFVALSQGDCDTGSLNPSALITHNKALLGGTVMWIYTHNVTGSSAIVCASQAPRFTEDAVFLENTGEFGQRLATQPTRVNNSAESPVVSVQKYQHVLAPGLNYELFDHYHQRVQLSAGLATVAIDSTSVKCGSKLATLNGEDVLTQGVVINGLQNGTIAFEHLLVYCTPRGSLDVIVSVQSSAFSTVTKQSLSISTSTNLTFRACQAGEYSDGQECLECPMYSYKLVANEDACTGCSDMHGVEYCFGSTMVIFPGFYRRTALHNQVLTCYNGKACNGGNVTGEASCAEGYTGELCGVCATGYFDAGNYQCKPCSNASTYFTPTTITAICVVGVFMLVAFLIYVVWRKRRLPTKIILRYTNHRDPHFVREKSNGESSPYRVGGTLERIKQRLMKNNVLIKIKILIATFQIIASSTGIFQVIFPLIFRAFTRVVNVINPQLFSLFAAVGCDQPIHYADVLLWSTVSPLIAAVVIACVGYAHMRYRAYASKVKELSDFAQKEAVKTVRDRYLTIFYMLTYLVLPSVTSTIFRVFLCVDVDPQNEDSMPTDHYLIADLSMSCESDEYRRWVIYASVMIVVYPVGIPLLYYIVLRNKSHLISQGVKALSPHALRQLSSSRFLWDAYEPQFWYWEVIESYRRLVLTAVVSVILPGSVLQPVIGMLFALFYIKIYGYYRPYEDDADDGVAESGQFQVFFTYFGVLLLVISSTSRRNLHWDFPVGVMMVAVNVLVPIIAASFYFRHWLKPKVQRALSFKLPRSISRTISKTISRNYTYNEEDECDTNSDEMSPNPREIELRSQPLVDPVPRQLFRNDSNDDNSPDLGDVAVLPYHPTDTYEEDKDADDELLSIDEHKSQMDYNESHSTTLPDQYPLLQSTSSSHLGPGTEGEEGKESICPEARICMEFDAEAAQDEC